MTQEAANSPHFPHLAICACVATGSEFGESRRRLVHLANSSAFPLILSTVHHPKNEDDENDDEIKGAMEVFLPSPSLVLPLPQKIIHCLTMAPASTKQVSLSSKSFEDALDRYIDYNKPDPLSRKQLEGWSLKWEDDDKNEKGDSSIQGFLSDPSHELQGTLEIGGEYLVVLLHVICRWKVAVQSKTTSASSSSTQHGQFFYSCHASARFWTKSELKEKHKGFDRADKKVQDKIRSKMVARLREDAYISKLFVETSDSSSSQQSAQVPKGPLLAEAKIEYSANDLEERVRVSEDVAEAIKRAVWASAESPLDVIEVILHLPFLPTTAHKSEGSTLATTQLANRAKLRLLEDAMCDACEKEGEGELLDDLKISDGSTKNPSDIPETDDDRSGEASPPKKKKDNRGSHKKSRSN
jgi:hypothetical protein